MALLAGQVALALDTLYEIKQSNYDTFSQKSSNLFINAGTVDIYSSNSATQPASLSVMTLNTADTAASGINAFVAVPRYIAIVQNGGTTTEITTTGLEIVNSLGAIS